MVDAKDATWDECLATSSRPRRYKRVHLVYAVYKSSRRTMMIEGVISGCNLNECRGIKYTTHLRLPLAPENSRLDGCSSETGQSKAAGRPGRDRF